MNNGLFFLQAVEIIELLAGNNGNWEVGRFRGTLGAYYLLQGSKQRGTSLLDEGMKMMQLHDPERFVRSSEKFLSEQVEN